MPYSSLTHLQTHFEKRLTTHLDSLNSPSSTIIEAMRYSALAKSKRLRPLLIYTTGFILNIDIHLLDASAIAIELMHTYSLIHDDLPAMDDDDLRRGKPSNHIQFNEATAILAGDALQNLSIETLLEDPLNDPSKKNKMAIHLLRASGYQGMIAGQNLDMELLESPELNLTTLQEIHLLKTACLLNACVKLPLLLADNVDMLTKKCLDQVGANLGLAFQIQDDYLDRYGNTDALGKHQGSDLDVNKKTFADFYEKEALEQLINSSYEQILSSLHMPNSHLLVDLITKLKTREW